MFEKEAEDNKPSYAFCAYNTYRLERNYTSKGDLK